MTLAAHFSHKTFLADEYVTMGGVIDYHLTTTVQ